MSKVRQGDDSVEWKQTHGAELHEVYPKPQIVETQKSDWHLHKWIFMVRMGDEETPFQVKLSLS